MDLRGIASNRSKSGESLEEAVGTIVVSHLDMSGTSTHTGEDDRPDFHGGPGLASHLDLIGAKQVKTDSSPGLLTKVESLRRKVSHLLALVTLPDQGALRTFPGDFLSQGPRSNDPSFGSAPEASVGSTSVRLTVS